MFRLVLHFEGISKADPEGYKLLNDILVDNNMTVSSVLAEISPKCIKIIKRKKSAVNDVSNTLFQARISWKNVDGVASSNDAMLCFKQ